MRTCPGTYEVLNNALNEAGTEELKLATKSEIIGYYEQEYGGKWKSQLARDLSTLTGQRADTIARRFRGARLTNERVSGKNVQEYKRLGQQLPGVRVPRKDIAGKKSQRRAKRRNKDLG